MTSTTITRRAALFGAAVSSVALAVPVAAKVGADEPICDRIDRLTEELSEALAEYQDGKFEAIVRPGDVWLSRIRKTAEERRDHHLAEFKKVCSELNPDIELWTTNLAGPDGDILIFAKARTGTYQGDGMYEAGGANVWGKRGRWSVRLMPYRLDGERVFELRCPGETLDLPERRFNTFIGRKLGRAKVIGGAA